jgi:hypothetical protein
VLISVWLFLFAAQPKEFFLDALKKLEQQSHNYVEGHTIAQAVSRWLHTAVARVQTRICGICGGQSGAGAGFL